MQVRGLQPPGRKQRARMRLCLSVRVGVRLVLVLVLEGNLYDIVRLMKTRDSSLVAAHPPRAAPGGVELPEAASWGFGKRGLPSNKMARITSDCV